MVKLTDSLLVTQIVEELREVFDKVLAVKVFNWRSFSPLLLDLLGFGSTINRLQFMELDAGFVVLVPLGNLLVIFLGDGSVRNGNGFILLLKGIEQRSMGRELLLESSKVNLGKIGRKLIDTEKRAIMRNYFMQNIHCRERAVLSLQTVKFGKMLRSEAVSELLPVDGRARDTLRSLRHLAETISYKIDI